MCIAFPQLWRHLLGISLLKTTFTAILQYLLCVLSILNPHGTHDAVVRYAQEVGTKQLGGVEIACLEMGEVPTDRVRAPFLAVGDWNGNVKILGLSPEILLEQVSCSRVQCSAVELVATQRRDHNR